MMQHTSLSNQLIAALLAVMLLALPQQPPAAAEPCADCHKKKNGKAVLPEHELLKFIEVQKSEPKKKVEQNTTTGQDTYGDPPPGFVVAPVSAASGASAAGSPGAVHPPALQSGTRSTTLQTGTQSTTLQTGTQSTTLKTGTESTLLETGTESTTLQGGTYGTILQANVERDAGPVNILILLDASRSMKESLKGGLLDFVGFSDKQTQKMDAAKVVLQNTLARIPNEINLGLRVFGQGFDNNPMTDCQQTALLVPVGKNNRRAIRDAVAQLKPAGLTPLTYALVQAERDLRGLPGTKTIILISDGAETCGGDPCTLIRKLEELGIKIKVDIVGLGLKGDIEARDQLNCIASASGGNFYDANTAGELLNSITLSVKQAISGKVITKMQSSEALKAAPAEEEPGSR